NVPSALLTASATEPLGIGSEQRSHVTPSVNGGSGTLNGTYTVMPLSGRVPFGAYTVPVIVVGGFDIAAQSTTRHPSPSHASGVPLAALSPHAPTITRKNVATSPAEQ